MTSSPFRDFLVAFFSHALTVIGTLFAVHGLVPKDIALGLAGYSSPLADLTLSAIAGGAGQFIHWINSEGAQKEILFLKQKANHLEALFNAKLDHLIPEIPILPTPPNQTQPTNPK